MPWEGIGIVSELAERAGTPLLLGPEGIAADEPTDGSNEETSEIPSPVDDPDNSPATTHRNSHSSRPATRSATSDETETTSTSSQPNTSDPLISSTSPAVSTTTSIVPPITSTQVRAIDDDGSSPVQVSSLAYLVPVFLLIAITIGAVIYRKCCARKRIDRESSTTFQSPAHPSRGVGWKEIKDNDTGVDEKDDVWNDDSDPEDDMEEQWRKVQFKESKSRPGLLDVSTTAGWLRSSAWKSARSINVDEGNGTPSGQKTVKLVTRSVPTNESLLPGEPGYTAASGLGQSSPGRFGSLRAIRDSLSSLSLAPLARRLERNKSPNERKVIRPPPPPPEEPAWIRPRAASPVNILSPPSQPHFFFQPTPAQSMVLHWPELSESEYTVSDTESLLSNVHQRSDLGKSGPRPTGGKDSLGSDLDRTPTKASIHSTSRPRTDHSPGKTPTGMRRSSAVRNLAKTPSTKQPKSGRTEKPTSPASLRKSKKQIKDEKARQRVETILQASWSDRALSSPSVSLNSLASPPDGNGKFPGWASPGVEQVGGIQARLAMLKSMEGGK
jgi:hypothetical protein